MTLKLIEQNAEYMLVRVEGTHVSANIKIMVVNKMVIVESEGIPQNTARFCLTDSLSLT